MLFFQESTPDTSSYMIAGYTIAFVVMGIYVASLLIRWRNLKQDLQILENLQAESRIPKSKPSKPTKTPKKTARPGPRKSRSSAGKKK